VTPGAGRRGEAEISVVRLARELAARGSVDHGCLFPAGSAALAMVSGGQDSLALVHVLATGALGRSGPGSVRALHVNHHLRGDESEADERLVVEACARMGVTLEVDHRPIAKAAGNVQEVAREARREAALEAAARWGCARIALGHTVDDQVETMLYRLGRYGGLAAFRAMLPSDPPWVRPLLGCRRRETAEYCVAQGLEFADDRGNAYPGYARTGIRERVLPAWEEELPGAVQAAARAAEVAAELEAYVARQCETLALDLVSPYGEGLSIAGLRAVDPGLRRLFLHGWIERHTEAPVSREAVLGVDSLLEGGGSAERAVSGGWVVRKEYDRLSLEPRAGAAGSTQSRSVVGSVPGAATESVPGPVVLPVPGEAVWGRVTVSAERVGRFQAPDPAVETYIDARCCTQALEVRGPRPGDRVRPLGGPGTRKLQDVLVDLRVPARDRPHVPLVVCAGRILWVCGLVTAEEGRIGRETGALVRLSVEASGS